MRSIFLAIAALVATTQAVSIQILRNSKVAEFARAQSTKKQADSSIRLFAQQHITDFHIPKGELTEE